MNLQFSFWNTLSSSISTNEKKSISGGSFLLQI
jgi:hypothetical protein